MNSVLSAFSSCWIEAVEAVMRATRGKGRFSAHLLKHIILDYYERHRLWPKGIVRKMTCIENWALKMGLALQRLASWQQFALVAVNFKFAVPIVLDLIPFLSALGEQVSTTGSTV